MRELIINADDCGISAGVNRAIEKCFTAEKITGVSLMPAGGSFSDAVRMLIKAGKTEVGVHFTLVGNFSPCARDKNSVSSLITSQGIFRKNFISFGAGYFAGSISAGHIRTELRSQIKRISDEGLKVTHIDSHEHIHMFPGIFRMVLNIADEFKVPYIRIPVESSGIIKKSFSARDLVRHLAIKSMTMYGNRLMAETHHVSSEAFCGHYHSGRITDDIFCHILESLCEGTSEIAFHPGVFTDGETERSSFHRAAALEYSTLMNGSWKDRANELGIKLIAHSDIQRQCQ